MSNYQDQLIKIIFCKIAKMLPKFWFRDSRNHESLAQILISRVRKISRNSRKISLNTQLKNSRIYENENLRSHPTLSPTQAVFAKRYDFYSGKNAVLTLWDHFRMIPTLSRISTAKSYPTFPLLHSTDNIFYFPPSFCLHYCFRLSDWPTGV